VELLVMGKNVFAQMSGALAPLREALAQALNRRAVDLWKGRPGARQLLHETSVRELMDPIPQPLLRQESSLREVSQAFVDHANEFFYVARDGQWLEGVVTITDLLRAHASGPTHNVVARDFMSSNPVALTLDDNCAVAAAAFREYRLKNLPIVESKENRKLAGCVRVRRLLAFITRELAAAEPAARPEAKYVPARGELDAKRFTRAAD